jgi:hypothetical protein
MESSTIINVDNRTDKASMAVPQEETTTAQKSSHPNTRGGEQTHLTCFTAEAPSPSPEKTSTRSRRSKRPSRRWIDAAQPHKTTTSLDLQLYSSIYSRPTTPPSSPPSPVAESPVERRGAGRNRLRKEDRLPVALFYCSTRRRQEGISLRRPGHL